MHAAVLDAAVDAHVVIMAAAVADYAPAHVAEQKIAKSDAPMTVTLERTPDILSELGRQTDRDTRILVGFAAETSDVVVKARSKRLRKHADLIVANDVSAEGVGFEVDTNAVTIVGGDGEETVSLRSKAHVADAVLDSVERIIKRQTSGTARV
jgi:phosphopantothenoylcysteine decarboxylase/phosphopantothenate--cysteine ligase